MNFYKLFKKMRRLHGYTYFILFAIAFCLVVFFPYHAVASQANDTVATVSPKTEQGVPSWLVGTGGAGCAGLGAMGKAKLDEILGKTKEVNSGLSSNLQDYTSSPQYLKDKIKVVAQEIQKTNDKCDALIRRFSYTERQLIRRIDNYVSYEDNKNKSTYN